MIKRDARASDGDRRRALVIGVDAYLHESNPKGAVADARDLVSALRKTGVSDLTVLLDREADRASVLREFDGLRERTKAGDTVFLSFAGVGSQEPSTLSEHILLLPSYEPQNAGQSEKIRLDEALRYVKDLEDRGASIVFVLDACFGERALREADARATPMSYRHAESTPIRGEPPPPREGAQFSPSDFKRSVILFAIAEDLKAPEIRIPGLGYRGALSYSVARALEGSVGFGAGGKTDAAEFASYVRQVVYQLSDGRQIVPTAFTSTSTKSDGDGQVNARGVRVQAIADANDEPKGSLEILLDDPPPQDGTPGTAAMALFRVKEPIRVASLDGQSAQLKGLATQVKYETAAVDANPDLLWDPATREVIANGERRRAPCGPKRSRLHYRQDSGFATAEAAGCKGAADRQNFS